ncbi:hypothetical protein CEY12_07790 [Chryseobacterium sp. T16E-39]|uniref:hypothetical protein n=1 Tax=Chryseobacterium sp. T16E-39 TaxID=2015076 RepID=UPI000B5B47F8|nr:hypothetical protein [Chryseobacterium sp. T16E-39]ASK30015.1 hypothetical protein CEY12_07790 [Chryseobacterium sp. T16E-39]
MLQTQSTTKKKKKYRRSNYQLLTTPTTIPIVTPTLTTSAVTTTISTVTTPVQKVLIQPGYATGDMFGIAAALIDDPNLHVVISTGNGSVLDPTDKGGAIQLFYLDSGIPQSRIHLVPIDDIRGPLKAPLRAKAREIQPTGKTAGVNHGTNYVAEHFSDEMRGRIRSAWNVNDSKDNEIKAWLLEKHIPLAGTNLLVLWSRFSGKKGDIHLEHDSSYAGIKRIASEAAPHYDAVIIAGDKGYKIENAGKYSQIADSINEELGTLKVFNLTEFWNDRTDALLLWGGNTRFGQFKIYDYFQRNFLHVRHLGFRSGNLEAMAMLGYNVRYMEEPHSEGGTRMESWHEHEHGRTKKSGKATGYERLLVAEPPTRSGKYLQRQRIAHPDRKDELRRPDWAPALRVSSSQKPADISTSDYIKGFSDADLRIIFNYLQLPVTL